MSMITASVAPAQAERNGFHIKLSSNWMNESGPILWTHLMQPKCQPPKTLHRTVRAKRVNRPCVRRMNLAMDPTSWCNLGDALDLRKICRQRRDWVRSRMELGTTPNQMCKLLRLCRLCSHHRPMLLKDRRKKKGNVDYVCCVLGVCVLRFSCGTCSVAFVRSPSLGEINGRATTLPVIEIVVLCRMAKSNSIPERNIFVLLRTFQSSVLRFITTANGHRMHWAHYPTQTAHTMCRVMNKCNWLEWVT